MSTPIPEAVAAVIKSALDDRGKHTEETGDEDVSEAYAYQDAAGLHWGLNNEKGICVYRGVIGIDGQNYGDPLPVGVRL